MEAFDDKKLLNLARLNYYGAREGIKNEGIELLLVKDKLSNAERNELLTFIEATRYVKPLSMKQLKSEIFALIGKPEGESYSYNSYANTVNRQELEHIYNYIKSKQK